MDVKPQRGNSNTQNFHMSQNALKGARSIALGMETSCFTMFLSFPTYTWQMMVGSFQKGGTKCETHHPPLHSKPIIHEKPVVFCL
jgi:hypothetical protein